MKAMVLKAANTPFVLETVPDPVPGPGEAVARVLACGSGLTIQHYKAGRTPATFPRIIGHEITGEIVELGADVSGLKVGDARRARIRPGETVAVFGAGGGLGIHMVMMARWARARVIAVDIAAYKFDACREAGADEVVDASGGDVADALLDLTGGSGIDVAVDFVSTASTLEAAARALGRAGRLVTLGGAGHDFRASAMAMLLNEQDLLGSRYVSRIEVIESLELLACGEIWPMVTDIRKLEEAEALHERIEKGEIIGRAALLIA